MSKKENLQEKYTELRKKFIEWYDVFNQMKMNKNSLSVPSKWLGIIPLDINELHHELTLLFIELEEIKREFELIKK